MTGRSWPWNSSTLPTLGGRKVIERTGGVSDQRSYFYLEGRQLERLQHLPDLLHLLPVRRDDAYVIHRQPGAASGVAPLPKLLNVPRQLVDLVKREARSNTLRMYKLRTGDYGPEFFSPPLD